MKLPAQGNAFSNARENSAPFFRRFYIYQKERFPLLGHGLLVAAFSFSAISYSRICRGAEGFVDAKTFAVGVFTTISLFLLVRIFDEFKDAEDDARFRKELPVPRGLITFRELALTGILVAIAQILVNLIFFPKMLWIYAAVVGYLSLMGKEFFVAEWLKKHQFWYVTSHMFIIPLIDIMFFLLATFVMVSLSMTKAQGIPVNLPVAASAAEQPKSEHLAISIKADGGIFLDNQASSIEQLPQDLQNYKNAKPDPKVIINGDQDVLFGKAVAVLDALRKAGLSKVAIATKVKSSAS